MHLYTGPQAANHLVATTEEVYPLWKKLRYTYLALEEAVVDFLRRLRRQYSVGLITNGPSRSQWEKIVHLDVERLFDSILVSGDLACEKPQAEIFLKMCERLGVLPEQCVMVGDRIDTDIAGGKMAGLAATVWIPLIPTASVKNFPSVDSNDHQPDFTICHVLDLASILHC